MRTQTSGRHEWRPYMIGRDESRPYTAGGEGKQPCRGAVQIVLRKGPVQEGRPSCAPHVTRRSGCQSRPCLCQHNLHRAHGLLILALLVCAWPALAQPPTVEESPTQIVVSNAYYRATVQRASGTLASVALPDGTEVLGSDRLYSDHGLYPEPYMVSSDKETNAAVELQREGERVTITSRGVLRGDGDLRDPQRRIEYTFSYVFEASPTIHIRYSATPGFTVKEPNGFFSYLIGVPQYSEWFAKSAEGVIFQPAGSTSTRTYQSSIEPLSPTDPWMGVLLPDATILAWSGFQGDPAPTNVFMHESGQGSTGVFVAWLCGPGVKDLVEGQPWTAEFDLHVWPQALRDRLELPGFLGW